jgi:hypothetical protein
LPQRYLPPCGESRKENGGKSEEGQEGRNTEKWEELRIPLTFFLLKDQNADSFNGFLPYGVEHGKREKKPVNPGGSVRTFSQEFRPEKKDSGTKTLGFMGESRRFGYSREDPAHRGEKSSAAGKGFKFRVDATTSILEGADSAKVT